MPLTNEDIVAALVAYYKRTGVDMTSLLGDPTFMSLKTPDKIEAIKRHAADLHAGSSDDLRPMDKKTIAVESVMTAFPAVAAGATILGQANKYLPGVKSLSLGQAVAGGVTLGLITGGMMAYAKAKQAQDFRKALRNNLANVDRDPSTVNAIGVLSSSNVMGQQYSLRDHLLRKIDELYKPERMDEWTVDRFHRNANDHQAAAAAAMNRRAAEDQYRSTMNGNN